MSHHFTAGIHDGGPSKSLKSRWRNARSSTMDSRAFSSRHSPQLWNSFLPDIWNMDSPPQSSRSSGAAAQLQQPHECFIDLRCSLISCLHSCRQPPHSMPRQQPLCGRFPASWAGHTGCRHTAAQAGGFCPQAEAPAQQQQQQQPSSSCTQWTWTPSSVQEEEEWGDEKQERRCHLGVVLV